MGTAILFPQEFLTSQSGQKHQSPGPAYPIKPLPISKRNRPTSAQSSDIGWLPVPAYAEISSPVCSDVKRIKARKAHHWSSSCTSRASDLSPHRFLQGQRQEAHFASTESLGLLEGVTRSQVEHVDARSKRITGQYRVIGIDEDVFQMSQNAGACFVLDVDISAHSSPAPFFMGESELFWICQGAPGSAGLGLKSFVFRATKHSEMNAFHENWNSNSEEKAIPLQSAAKSIMANSVGSNDMFLTERLTRKQEKFSFKGVVQLRRSMTEPPVAEETRGQATKLYQERWAGPAYSSSPDPSSLPLPKFCLPHMKSSSVDSPLFMKQHSASLYTKSGLQSSANIFNAFDENEGIWNAAFATKKLRRLLNLDS